MAFPSSITISRWKIGCLLRVTGTDAKPFLQGQFTNDLRGLAENEGVYGLWLNQKGKVLGDSFVLAGLEAGEFWVVSYFSKAEEVKQRLESYVIADDVIIEDVTANWSGISLLGVDATGWLGSEKRVGLIFSGRRSHAESREWISPKSDQALVDVELEGAREIDAGALAGLRIEAGIPAVPHDIGPADLPAEGGLEVTAISYTKGCYLGQEVMARLKSMGQVRRGLMRVRGNGPAPLMPSKLTQEEKPVGELRSAIAKENGFVGLAMISLINFRAERPAMIVGGEPVVLETISAIP